MRNYRYMDINRVCFRDKRTALHEQIGKGRVHLIFYAPVGLNDRCDCYGLILDRYVRCALRGKWSDNGG